MFADVLDGLFQTLDLDSLLFGIIPKRCMDRLFRQKGAVDFHGGQAVERLHHRLVRNLQRLLHRLALHEFGCHAACRDRRTAAEGLELRIPDHTGVVDIEIDAHDIPADSVAHGTASARILDFPHVARVGEMIHYSIGIIHCHGLLPFETPLPMQAGRLVFYSSNPLLVQLAAFHLPHRTWTRRAGMPIR